MVDEGYTWTVKERELEKGFTIVSKPQQSIDIFTGGGDVHIAYNPSKTDNLQQVKNDDYSTIIFTGGSLFQEIQKAVSEIKPKPPVPTPKK